MINYYGSKSLLAKHIIPYFNVPHKHYVEVFGGSAKLLLNKKPSLIETYNDLDGNIVNVFRVIRDRSKNEELIYLLNNTPRSRREFVKYKKLILKSPEDFSTMSDIQRAYIFLYQLSNSYSGDIYGGFRVTKERALKKINFDKLRTIQKRLVQVNIENLSWNKLISLYDSESTLFYLDPPYPKEIRKPSGRYTFEMTARDHKRLIRRLSKLKGKAILSSYENDTYNRLLDFGWTYKEVVVSCVSVKAIKVPKDKRKEVIWFSPQFRLRKTMKMVGIHNQNSIISREEVL